jgi:hypothetical protein
MRPMGRRTKFPLPDPHPSEQESMMIAEIIAPNIMAAEVVTGVMV